MNESSETTETPETPEFAPPDRRKPRSHKLLWRRTNARLVPFALLALAGVFIATSFGSVRSGSLNHKLIALGGVVLFVGFGIAS